MQPTTAGSAVGTKDRHLAWHTIRWVLAVGLVAGWVLMLLVPGTLPWLFIAIAGIAGIVLVTSVALPDGGTSQSQEPGRP